jgi:hypothetical protein
MNALSEQHKMELAAITEDRKLEMKALSEQHKVEIAAIQEKLNTAIQEKPEGAEAKEKAAQAKDDRIFNLMMKRKELDTAGFSAIEIDDRLPFPQQDDDERSNKKRRRIVKKEEET